LEVIYWIQIFISPFLLFAFAGVIVYFNNTDNWWVSIVLMIIGAVLGTFFAERIRRKRGTVAYMGGIKGNSEFAEKEEPEKNEIRLKYTCPCCGYRTLDKAPPGTYIICPVCFWEDDPVQFDDPNFEGGANIESLKQAQQNFIKYGWSSPEMRQNTRKPNSSEPKDVNWKAY